MEERYGWLFSEFWFQITEVDDALFLICLQLRNRPNSKNECDFRGLAKKIYVNLNEPVTLNIKLTAEDRELVVNFFQFIFFENV